MADIASITSASSYTGNANLGGSSLGSFQLDVRPLQEAAAYTFQYNQQMYNQRQKEIEAAANEMAKLTQYDLNLAPDEDRKKIVSEYKEFFDWTRNNIDALDFMHNPEKWLEYNERKARFEDRLNGGKARTAIYNIREKEIAETTNEKLKSIRRRKLDEEVRSTDLQQQLKHTQQYDLAQIAVKPAARKTFDVTKIGENFYGTRTLDVIDMAALNGQANSLTIGMVPPDQQPDWSRLTAEEREERMLAWEEQVATGRTEPIETTKHYNAAWQELKNTRGKDFFNDDGTVKTEAVINSGINPIASIVGMAETFNQKMRDMKDQISQGYFKDQMGNTLNFGVGGLKESDYAEINVKDGLTTQEYNKLKIFAISGDTKYKTEIKETDLGIKRQKLAIEGQRAKAYIDNLNARTKKLKTDMEKEQVFNDEWRNNIAAQPTLIQSTGPGGELKSVINAGTSIPMWTFNQKTGKVEQLIPHGAIKVFDKYEINDAGEVMTDAAGNKIPAKNAKLLHTIGGQFGVNYVSSKDSKSGAAVRVLKGKTITGDQMNMLYQEFKERRPDLVQSGVVTSLDDFLKLGVQSGRFAARVDGQNGTATEGLNRAALVDISNRGAGSKELGAFETYGDDEMVTSQEESETDRTGSRSPQ